MSVSYYKPIHFDNLIYSLDMVRLDFEVALGSLDEFNSWLNKINMNIDIYSVGYYQSFKKYNYRHLWNIDFVRPVGSECTITIGMDLGRNRDDKLKGFIEFNPNKCENNIYFNSFWHDFVSYQTNISLVRYDCAIDIPFPRNEVFMVRNQRANYHLILDRLTSKTEYQGQRSHNGYCKLYDKTVESKLDYPLTRYEITFDSKAFTSVDTRKLGETLPTICYSDSQLPLIISEELTDNDIVLIQLLKMSNDINYWFGKLSRRKRKKIEPYLANKVLSLNVGSVVSVRDQAIDYELNVNKL